MKSKYRVLLPIDVGDGIVHQHGEEIELELETAKAYRHALVAVETEEDGKVNAERN